MTAAIFEIKRFAVHDGDGIRTTVFFKGCPLRCVWCHNPEGLTAIPQTAHYSHKCIGCGECKKEGFTPEDCLGEATVLYGKEMTVEELLPILLEDRDFYETSGGGVTLSGGECLMQADFCAELLKKLKENEIHTAVDTCGFVSKESLDKVIPYTDVFLYDIKAYDEEVHIKCTEVSNRIILENLAYLDSLNKKIEVRIPYVPDYNDDQIEKIAHFLAPLQSITKIRVLPYHNYAGSKYKALDIVNTLPEKLPTDEEIKIAVETIKKLTNFVVLS
ncbi:MAG: glycyl-radical enzyme activating protein [Clostridia bacterium]|nr:glycyl-radical enzyme activating protein [Clostridia bacterium]MBR3715458.1 glycyl-radical enzyme activating protein [Clostridia bacterium]